MVKFFINRPIFATVLALIIVVAGLVTLNILPIAQYPDITPPTVQVSAVYPGADAQTVSQTVGLPIEQQVNGVDGMLYMSSNSSSSGVYSLTITFAVGTDIDMATVMVQNRVSIAQSSLPEAVIVQGITTKKQSSNIVMLLSLTSKDSLYDGLYLSNYASLNLTGQLARLPGVGSVSVMGAGNYSMRVWLDPEVMRIRNLTPDAVLQAISTQNRQVSAGYVGQPIAKADNPYQYTLTVKGRLTTPEEFGNIILRTESGGKILRLKDVARIELGSSSYNVTSRLKGQQAATIAIYQLPGSNSLEVSKAVRNKMEEIASTLPDGVEYGVTLDTTEVINASIDEVLVTFLETTALVVLKNWKERKGKGHTAEDVVTRFNREAYGIQEAQVFALVPPAIPGLGASGGLQLQLEDRKNLGPTEMQQAIQTLLEHYHSKPQLLSLSSMYQANVPQYKLNIDRDKVQLLGLQLSDVFSTLSYYMGAAYVNDFVEFGRIYQVKIEANDQAQKVIDDVMRLSLENTSGKMVPFSAFTQAEQQLGLDQINLYNMYSSASITCIANPEYSSGEAIKAMEELIQEQLGDNFGYEWTSVAYQETKEGSSTMLIFGMALLVAFLVLSAQYESWTSPLAAIMGLPIALSAKNGILIVEFARDYRAAGNPIREAALEAGHVRLRPILMTSFAFVLGVMPLLFATGAGAASRVSLGAAVVFGMAVNTIFATIFIPSFYEWMQTIQEKWLDKASPNKNVTKP